MHTFEKELIILPFSARVRSAIKASTRSSWLFVRSHQGLVFPGNMLQGFETTNGKDMASARYNAIVDNFNNPCT